jgi:hypothetical protein
MLQTMAASTGINVTFNDSLFNRTGGLLYSSPAAGIGKGERSDPNMNMPTWTPGPGEYVTRLEATANYAPKFR